MEAMRLGTDELLARANAPELSDEDRALLDAEIDRREKLDTAQRRTGATVCDVCSALVYDAAVHAEWHAKS